MPLLLLLVLLVVVAAGCASEPQTPPRPPATKPAQPPAPQPKPIAPRERDVKVRVPQAASGRYAVVPGGGPARPGRGAAVRYLVEVERGLPFDPVEFAAEVHKTLNDIRGWARFERVDHGPVRVRVALSSPHLTTRECRPLRTGGELSCWNGHRSVINALRWAKGVPQYKGDLAAYRDYVISHEVGHGLGHHHRSCPGPGRLAPVMAQQSKSLGRCRPNPWPFPNRERDEER
ncbi:DUF3152 domain-containing protein [Nonomuraea insulae]|uniref:DUF3152 domain-containing protein n=1 Tax=Nonomuraea insulae TaxID=1616787 RepID=A0ABW1CZN3_9ACTN